MSDPVKNAEVEDVLSSIRRLVSEDKRPLQASKPAATPDRLVLTPALRVEDKVDPSVQEAPLVLKDKADISDMSKGPDEDQFVWQDEGRSDVRDSAEAAEVSPSAEVKAQAHADNYDDDPYGFDDDAGVKAAAEQTVAAEDVAVENTVQEEPFSDQHAGEDWTQATADIDDAAPQEAAGAPGSDAIATETASQSKAALLSAKIAALETVIGDISDEWEPDGASQDAYAGSEPQAMAWEDNTAEDDVTDVMFQHYAEDADVEEIEEAVMLPSDEGALAAGSDPEAMDSAADVQEAIRATEDVLSQQADSTETVKPEARAIQETPVQDALRAEPTEVETASAEATPDEGTDGGLDLSAEDQLLDEEALRDMISEIVHGELQGALGERITRNVRRLVRREIHRALTARDLD